MAHVRQPRPASAHAAIQDAAGPAGERRRAAVRMRSTMCLGGTDLLVGTDRKKRRGKQRRTGGGAPDIERGEIEQDAAVDPESSPPIGKYEQGALRLAS